MSILKSWRLAPLALVLFLFSKPIHAQNSLNIIYILQDSSQIKNFNKTYKPETLDFGTEESLDKIYRENQNRGFLDYSIDSFYFLNDSLSLWVYPGRQYSEARVFYQKDSIADLYTDLDDSYETKAQNLNSLMDSLGQTSFDDVYEQGYLQAILTVDSLQLDSQSIAVYNSLNSAEAFYLDSIINAGDLDINYTLLCKLLDFEKGQQFKPSMLSDINTRINAIDFINLKGKPMIVLKNNKLSYEMPLFYRNVNQANIILGIQPNSIETDKLMITGDANLKLVNTLGRAEKFEVSWQQLQFLSPRLIAKIELPYIAYSNLGLSAEFNYFKKDTNWNNIRAGVSADYWIDQNHSFSLYYGSDVSNILNIDTAAITSSEFRMDFVDFSKKSYGIRYRGQKLDALFGARKGHQYLLDIAAKNRKVNRNIGIEGLNTSTGIPYSQIYDSLDNKNWQGALLLAGEIYVPIRGGKNFVWYNKMQGNYLQGKDLFKNEMIQIGGFSTLRGYDEQSIYVRDYSMLLTELQYHLGRNGYMYAFYNGAYINQYFSSGFRYSFKMGFGLGLNIQLENSRIGINYAIGQDEENKFDFRNGKVHLGYISTF